MLRYRSKVLLYYAEISVKNIMGLGKQWSNSYFGVKEHLNPKVIPKYKNKLIKPYIYQPILTGTPSTEYERIYFIDICRFKHQILPEGFPKTSVIGYRSLVKVSEGGGTKYLRSYPGGIFEEIRGIPTHMIWRNKTDTPVNMCIHTGRNSYPDILYESDNRNKEVYHLFLNNREPAMYRYYDQNSSVGLNSLYIINEDKKYNRFALNMMDLPAAKYEYPIIIQDCSFYKDGSFDFTQSYGDAVMVNGKVWPSLDVERRQYRFIILNGSSSRYYNLMLSNDIKFTVIGRGKGMLTSSINQSKLHLAPGEKADVLIDFSRLTAGTSIYMTTVDKTGRGEESPNHDTREEIMRFDIPENSAIAIRPIKLPNKLI